MLRNLPFPKQVTNASPQSRHHGQKLGALLSGKTPASIIEDHCLFKEVVEELWHELPTITSMAFFHAIPIYTAYHLRSIAEPELFEGGPASFQLMEGCDSRLAGLAETHPDLFQLLSPSEIYELLVFTKTLEEASSSNLEPLIDILENIKNLRLT